MTTKTITGTYTSGYYLQPTFTGLNITSTASVYGSGVTTSPTQGAAIDNQGKVEGTGNGITLNDGGSVTNGSASNYNALIEGVSPIVANNAAATVINFGTIESTSVYSSAYHSYGNNGYLNRYYTTGASIALNAGGTVTNQNTGFIQNGVLISGASGTVTNNRVIGQSVKETVSYVLSSVNVNYDTKSRTFADGASVSLQTGGKVTNGRAGMQLILTGASPFLGESAPLAISERLARAPSRPRTVTHTQAGTGGYSRGFPK